MKDCEDDILGKLRSIIEEKCKYLMGKVKSAVRARDTDMIKLVEREKEKRKKDLSEL